jgi:hypothetical protein
MKKLLMVAVAATLGIWGTLFVASAASAVTLPTTTNQASTLRACLGSTCPTATPPVASGRSVTSYCIRGTFDLVYAGPLDGRGGFLQHTHLRDGGQSTQCNDNAINGFVTNTATTLRSCGSTDCLNFGNIPVQAAGAAFCILDDFVLVYVAPLAANPNGDRAGFLPRSALSGNLPTASC